MSCYHKLVFFAIKRNTKLVHDKPTSASYISLTENISIRQVRYSLKFLVEQGYLLKRLNWTKYGDHAPTTYMINSEENLRRGGSAQPAHILSIKELNTHHKRKIRSVDEVFFELPKEKEPEPIPEPPKPENLDTRQWIKSKCREPQHRYSANKAYAGMIKQGKDPKMIMALTEFLIVHGMPLKAYSKRPEYPLYPINYLGLNWEETMSRYEKEINIKDERDSMVYAKIPEPGTEVKSDEPILGQKELRFMIQQIRKNMFKNLSLEKPQ